MKPTPIRFFGRVVFKIVVILLITLVMLEVLTRLVWRDRECVPFSDKELCLLPYPIVTQKHLDLLDRMVAAEAEGSNYVQFDPLLGWSIRPNTGATLDGTYYDSNDLGLRGQRNYELTPPPGVTRLAVFGPSFAHADDVLWEDSWPYLMEQTRPDWQVMNWGVRGYGTDQAYLRYITRGVEYHPDVVIIVYEEENLRRNVNRYRPFFFPATGTPLTKPVFIPWGETLALLDNPFQTVAALRDTAVQSPNRFLDMVCPHDAFCVRERYASSPLDALKSYRFLRTLVFEVKYGDNLPHLSGWDDSYNDPLQTGVTRGLLNMFVEDVRERGAVPVVVVFSYRGTLDLLAAGQLPIYHDLVQQLEQDGVPVLDLAPVFVQAETPGTDFTGYYAPGGHLNEAGNRVVCRAIIEYLIQESIMADDNKSK